ncbi:MAG: AmmeMemoRadiSam system protein B [Candidatus Omnitrophota bacterium]
MAESLIRKPVVDGKFYSSSAARLKKDIEGFLDRRPEPLEAIGCLLPHAGYIYSGRVAGKTISRLKLKATAILLGPNHTGYGAPFSITTKGCWQTPLGTSEINTILAKGILDKSIYLSDDATAHAYEHSLEVQLPFLQYLREDIQIVPIAVTEGQIAIYRKIGESIAATLKESNTAKNALIIASSDMTHYEPQESAEKKDKAAIEAILDLDEARLINRVKALNISMCGYVPAVIMIIAAKLLGATSAELINYQTSGEISGDYQSVVGYAGIIIK